MPSRPTAAPVALAASTSSAALAAPAASAAPAALAAPAASAASAAPAASAASAAPADSTAVALPAPAPAPARAIAKADRKYYLTESLLCDAALRFDADHETARLAHAAVAEDDSSPNAAEPPPAGRSECERLRLKLERVQAELARLKRQRKE